MNVAEILQNLTHSMCYVFGRTTNAVSLCAPAYYADLVCGRARCYLERVTEDDEEENSGPPSVKVHENLENDMFYI